MSRERCNQIIKEAYEKYHQENKKVVYLTFLLKEEFINKCKTDSEFSQEWGTQIEERELSLEERYKLANINGRKERLLGEPYYTDEQQHSLLDELVPTKQITLKYQDETVITYE